MNEDYLWDKSGHDPKIEGFEKALREFAHQESAPPTLPTKVVNFAPAAPSKRFRYVMAAAACLAIFVLASVFILMRSSIRSADDEVAVVEPGLVVSKHAPVETERSERTLTGQPAPLPAKEITAHSEKRLTPLAHKSSPATANEKTAVRLSKEEAFAYDQLKLALSITGSKLKLIKDKVNSAEDKKSVIKSGR